MSAWLVNTAGLLLIALVVIWFWLWPNRATQAQKGLTIKVADGSYDPNMIEATAGQPLELRFIREDPSPCAERVIFHGLGINAELPVGKAYTVRLTPQQPGTYRFTCDMQMYQGRLRVKPSN